MPCLSVANDGTVFYFHTNKDAPQYKLVSVDIADPPEKRVFKELIPEDKDAHLEDVRAVNGDHAVVVYKRNVGFSLCTNWLHIYLVLCIALNDRSLTRSISTNSRPASASSV